jgi:hypothetical protein
MIARNFFGIAGALLLIASSSGPARAQSVSTVHTLPRLGDPVPVPIARAAGGRLCTTGQGHREPCATVKLGRERFTLGWDAATRRVTYLYSSTLLTDSELSAGGSVRLTNSIERITFPGGFISPQWCDRSRDLSGDALWCAVLKPVSSPEYGEISGFVQSIYLTLPKQMNPYAPIRAGRPDARQRTPTPPQELPRLGDEVPAALLKRPRTCDTGEDRKEPCADLTLRHDQLSDRVTVAWDATTKRVTYLYSTTLATDDDIRAGDVLPIESDAPITPFPLASVPHRFVTSDWCDTVSGLSGDTLWCAVMTPVRPRSGKVLGFVQSLYLALPDPDAPPLHQTRLRRSPRVSR